MSAGSGPGRRLTEAEEDRAAALYQEGASTRCVARELEISRSSAQALRVRLLEAGRLTSEETTVDHDQAGAAENLEVLPATGDAAELEQLAAQSEAQAAEVTLYTDRAEASLQAVANLERERLTGLAEGRDMQGLRERRRNAEDDARDATDAARLARGRFDEIGRQITAVQTRIADRQLRAELAAAIEARDAVMAKTGERQRTAVLAVRTAAEEFCAAMADERAAAGRVEQLAAQIALGGPMPAVPPPVSTAISPPYDAVARQPVALARAVSAARDGNAVAVAEQLGICNGWLPPGPAELAAEWEHIRALRAGQATPPAPRSVDMDPRFGASHGVDEYGNALPPPSPAELERRRQPAPAGPAGWLGGQPFPM